MKIRKGSTGDWGAIVIIILFAIFIAGVATGRQYVPEPEIVYIRESNQPVKVFFEKEINPYYEVQSYETTLRDREFIVYYWVEENYINQEYIRTLHWTWKEVTGPQ
jgi:hypothetical protein